MPIRIGLVGAGWVTAHHLRAYRALSGAATVVGIADPDPVARAARQREFDIPHGFDSAEAMLDALDLDAVDVASPREHHAAAVRLASGRGLAILCQKPLAPTLAEAEALVRDLPDGTRLMVHDNWRFRPHYRLIARWLDEGRIGRLRRAELHAVTSGLLPDEAGRLFALERQPMLAGLDRMLLMEVLIHHVDTLRFLLGDMTLLGAVLGRSCRALRGEDRATLLLSAGDAPVSVTGDFATHGAPRALSDRIELQGTEGAILLRDGQVTHLRDGTVVASHQADLDADYAASYQAAIGHFLDCTRRGHPYETGPDDNLRTLALIERAYETGFRSPPPSA